MLPALESKVFNAPLPPIEDEEETLAPFHRALLALIRGERKEPIRIAMYGDSNMTQDGISGGARRVLQTKFGDSGHGYVALGRAWPWYLHMDVRHGPDERAWTSFSTSTHPPADHILGFANMAFENKHAGAKTWVETAVEDAPIGKTASRFRLYYLERKRSGGFYVTLDGEKREEVSANAAETHAREVIYDAKDAHHRFELTATSDKPVRVFGVALERNAPGIVVDSLGTGALNYEQMTRVESETRNDLLLARKYDLVIFHLGANIFGPGEAVTSGWTKAVIDAHRRAVPNVPVILLSPSDIDHKKGDVAGDGSARDDKHSDKRIVALVSQLRRAAKSSNSAYWDFWSAMGGEMSMLALRKKGLASTDLIHFVRPSAILMGERFAHALVASTEAYAAKHPACSR